MWFRFVSGSTMSETHYRCAASLLAVVTTAPIVEADHGTPGVRCEPGGRFLPDRGTGFDHGRTARDYAHAFSFSALDRCEVCWSRDLVMSAAGLEVFTRTRRAI